MLNMKKIFLLLSAFLPFITNAQIGVAAPPEPMATSADGPPATGYPAPIDNTFYIIVLLLVSFCLVFYFFKKYNFNK